jgi:DNA repair protein RadC
MPKTKPNATGIASWPQDERPRERLLAKGAQALTDAELIAILIRVGFKGTNAVEMARQLLKRFGSLRAMVEAPVSALLQVKGLKGAKAAQLMAAMEIARRVPVRYHFNMISPATFNRFFQKLRSGEAVGFRSDLDVAMTNAAKATD